MKAVHCVEKATPFYRQGYWLKYRILITILIQSTIKWGMSDLCIAVVTASKEQLSNGVFLVSPSHP